MRTVLATIGVATTIFFMLLPLSAQEKEEGLSPPKPETTMTLHKEHLPPEVVLVAFITHMGGTIEAYPGTAPQLLEPYGIPASEAHNLILLKRRIQDFRTGEAAKTAIEAEHRTRSLTRRSELRKARELTRASLEGAAVGRWLAQLENHGIQPEAVIAAIKSNRQFSTSVVYVDEIPDVDFEARATATLRQSMHEALGRSLEIQ